MIMQNNESLDVGPKPEASSNVAASENPLASPTVNNHSAIESAKLATPPSPAVLSNIPEEPHDETGTSTVPGGPKKRKASEPNPAMKKQGTKWHDETKKRSKKKRHGGGAPRFTRRLWNDSEDEAIAALVVKYGTKKWTLISRKLQEEFGISGRSGKQCRER